MTDEKNAPAAPEKTGADAGSAGERKGMDALDPRHYAVKTMPPELRAELLKLNVPKLADGDLQAPGGKTAEAPGAPTPGAPAGKAAVDAERGESGAKPTPLETPDSKRERNPELKKLPAASPDAETAVVERQRVPTAGTAQATLRKSGAAFIVACVVFGAAVLLVVAMLRSRKEAPASEAGRVSAEGEGQASTPEPVQAEQVPEAEETADPLPVGETVERPGQREAEPTRPPPAESPDRASPPPKTLLRAAPPAPKAPFAARRHAADPPTRSGTTPEAAVSSGAPNKPSQPDIDTPVMLRE